MRRRIYTVYSAKKAYFIESVEEAYGNYDLLYGMLKDTAKKRSELWERNCAISGIRLYRDDFEGIFWDSVTEAVEKYDGRSDFWLLERIDITFKSRAKDLIKWTRRHKRQALYMAQPLPDGHESMYSDPSVNIEKDVTDRFLVQQMLSEPSLSDDERELLRFLYVEPDSTLQQIADHLSRKHAIDASRMLERLRRKLAAYAPS